MRRLRSDGGPWASTDHDGPGDHSPATETAERVQHSIPDASTVFRAVSDPTRRRILDLLSEGDRSVNELVAEFGMSQSAVSQHLKVLRTAGLAQPRRSGKQRIYQLDAAPLREAHQWLARFDRFWDEKLDALGDFLDQSHGQD